MNGGNFIRKIQMECPLCDKVHEIEERTHIAKTIIKGEEVNYEETYYFCQNSDEDENEFVTGKMESDNLLNARNAYRKSHGLLTSDQIVAIRENPKVALELLQKNANKFPVLKRTDRRKCFVKRRARSIRCADKKNWNI